MLKKIFILSLICNSLNAEIITDGTLGHNDALPGPNYFINADLGQQYGDNLFHSFQDFNLNNSETATFSGPNSVQNILSRVTGGNPSNIDGLIISTIPNADMYFLNPYGIMFGPNAKLDIQGSFHASTADYLRLGKNGYFAARNPSDSILTIAPVTTFGFLTNTPASIELLDSRLQVHNHKTLSFIGGDLLINVSEIPFGNKQPFFAEPYPSQLLAGSGRINLFSGSEPGEVSFDEFSIQGGQIIMNQSHISTIGINGGDIFIRGSDLQLVDSLIDSITLEDGGVIDISVDNLELKGNKAFSGIYSNTFGHGRANTIGVVA